MKALLLVVVVVALCLLADARQLHARHKAPTGWTKLNRAAGHHHVRFVVALNQRNLDVLESELLAISDPQSARYQEFKTIDEVLDIVSPPKAEHDAVWSWLSKAGVTQIRSFGDAIEAITTIAVAEKLFSTTFFHFSNAAGTRIIRQWGAYSVPESVEDFVDFVAGLSEFPVPHYKPHKSALHASPNGQQGVSPQTVQAIYQSPANPTIKSATSVGVIEFVDQYYSPVSLQTFANQFGLTIAPVNTTVGNNNPDAPGIEAELDIQYAAGVGLNVPSWFWIEADNVWLYGWAVHFFSTPAVPYVVSVSYGWSEADQCEAGIGANECSQLGVDSTGYVQRVNAEFQKIGLRGISIIVASGDSGANGRTDEYCTSPTLLPDYPTASPWVTSVGATQINNPVYKLPNPPPGCDGDYSCATGGTEVAVSFDHANFASGGGFSNVGASQSYQTAAVQGYLKSGVALPPASYFNATGRAYPDVAGFGADVLIYSGGLQPVGGTSCASPIFAGIISLLNDLSLSTTQKPLGFLNPLLYQMQASSPSTFTDITVGDNKCTEGGCQASCQGFLAYKGWDPVTGLGTPNYPEMYAYIKQLLAGRRARV